MQRLIATAYNETMIQRIKVPNNKYLSADHISKSSTSSETHGSLSSTDFLNTLKFIGIPNHELTNFKVRFYNYVDEEYKPSKWTL